MKERIIIVFIAVLIGLLITTLGFFLYESSKNVPEEKPKTITKKPVKTEEGEEKINLAISEPKNESIVDRRTIQVKGKTDAQNLLVVSSNQEDVVATPTTDGKFSVSLTIDAGTNIIITRAINTHGEGKIDERTVTYSTEEF